MKSRNGFALAILRAFMYKRLQGANLCPITVSHQGPRLVSHQGPRLVSHQGPRLVSHQGPKLVSHQGRVKESHPLNSTKASVSASPVSR